jgi:hypothetical protein
MVERITDEAIRLYAENLDRKGLLSPKLSAEIGGLIEEMGGFSNWTEAGAHFRSKGVSRLAGMGPMSKFLRALAYALEKLDAESERLLGENVRIDKILIPQASSGCSDYHGEIQVIAQKEDGTEIPVAEGRFVWDCAAHGMPQPQAAQELGYRCMISFPKLNETIIGARA